MADENIATDRANKSSPQNLSSLMSLGLIRDEDFKALAEMKYREEEKQTPVYDLFVKHGFKQEADALYSNGKNRIGRYIAILDSNPVSKELYNLAGSGVYEFLHGMARSVDENQAENRRKLIDELNKIVNWKDLVEGVMRPIIRDLEK